MWKTIVISALIFLIILSGVGVFVLYKFFSKQPLSIAYEYLNSNNVVSVTISDDFIAFIPAFPKDIAILFYPEILVYPEAYAPLCYRIAQNGYSVIIIKPFMNLTILSNFKAKQIIENNPLINNWILIGHGTGGAISTYLVKKYPDLIKGLVLLAAYPYADISNYDIKVLTLYADYDSIVSFKEISERKNKFPPDSEFVKIEGGSHSHFAYYEKSLGETETILNREKQQEIVLEKILDFLKIFAY
ncbi:MAG: hypothetical protein H0Z24_08500 [Thermosipho sp. (in: Bacteria)]|nr:hypothetical protein [Thermosipho sp. (in: thermotogales)]